MDGFGHRTLLIYNRYTELESWTDSDGAMVIFHRWTEGDGGRRRTSKNINMLAEVNGRADGRSPSVVAQSQNIYHNRFFSALDNLTFISINCPKG